MISRGAPSDLAPVSFSATRRSRVIALVGVGHAVIVLGRDRVGQQRQQVRPRVGDGELSPGERLHRVAQGGQMPGPGAGVTATEPSGQCSEGRFAGGVQVGGRHESERTRATAAGASV